MNIELHTLSEVIEVTGVEGDFTVKVRQNPRYVDMEKCIACGLCAEKCPKKVPSEFDMGMGPRKAAYIKYGQAVPLKYAIDSANCIYFKNGKCRACEKFCPTGAINFEEKEQIVELNVGSLVLTPGFKPFNPKVFENYAYTQFKDVVTSMEYERLLSASGPCMGHLKRPSDNTEPKKIAWLQCVGSRAVNKCDNAFCSSVCCMYAIKQALVTGEHLTGGGFDGTIFYMDMRTHGKDFERYYDTAKGKGINFIRTRLHTVNPGPDGCGVELRWADEQGKEHREPFDMLVLSVGLEADKANAGLARELGVNLDEYRFAQTSSFAPVATSRPGIFAAGAFQAPKDIPQAVTEASGAAAAAMATLAAARGTLTKEKTYPAENDVAGQEPRVGVFVCSCGINIAGVVDVKAVVEYAKGLPNVVFVDNNLFTCSQDTQVLLAEKIKEHGLNRIVIAACTPRTHEPLFMDTLREAGLNQYLVEMANIRNQNSWVHQKEPAKATEKAMDQVRMAVAKASMLQPLKRSSIDVVQKALVVGGGVSGMTSALGLANQGFDVALVEKADRLGGNAWNLHETWKGELVRPYLENLIGQVEMNPKITVYLNSSLKSAHGSVGDFVSEIDANGERVALKYGVAVVAVGAKESKPVEYMYGQDARVMTHQEFEKELEEHEAAVKKAGSAVFIQCVGSREPNRPYCSRVCCTHTVESALRLKKINPDMDIYVLYRDMRTYGEREVLFQKARELGVMFIKYELDGKPVVSKNGDALNVVVKDHVLLQDVLLTPDYLVLASAIVPHDNKELVELYKCATNADGFLSEAHAKLRPVDMSVDGLFLAGLCHYPKPLDEAVAQAQAATARASVLLTKPRMELDAIKSYPTANCDGCALCVDTCPYGAITLVTYAEDGRDKKKIATNQALCKGCGICEATCPKQGVYVHGFTLDQIRAQVDAALENI